MSETKYTEEHEWLRVNAAGEVVIGITHYAQEQLGDVVFVELPAIGASIAVGSEVAVVESVKAASDIKAPLSGEVTAVNDKLHDAPELANADPEGEGWFFAMTAQDIAALDEYMDEAAYQQLINAS